MPIPEGRGSYCCLTESARVFLFPWQSPLTGLWLFKQSQLKATLLFGLDCQAFIDTRKGVVSKKGLFERVHVHNSAPTLRSPRPSEGSPSWNPGRLRKESPAPPANPLSEESSSLCPSESDGDPPELHTCSRTSRSLDIVDKQGDSDHVVEVLEMLVFLRLWGSFW